MPLFLGLLASLVPWREARCDVFCCGAVGRREAGGVMDAAGTLRERADEGSRDYARIVYGVTGEKSLL